jgi:hypothetical protein
MIDQNSDEFDDEPPPEGDDRELDDLNSGLRGIILDRAGA